MISNIAARGASVRRIVLSIAMLSSLMASAGRLAADEFWSRTTSEEQGEANPALCEAALATGLQCEGRYCDRVTLKCQEKQGLKPEGRWLDYISDGERNEARCAPDEYVSGLRCRGRYCDDISLRCTQAPNIKRKRCFWSAAASEEGGGRVEYGAGAYLAGMRCQGDYCDKKQSLVCIEPVSECTSRECQQELAESFAPILRFDQKQGEPEKCLPSDAASYFEARKSGDRSRICNTDLTSLYDASIPIYYQIQRCSASTTTIMYWFFYGYQDTCAPGLGDHDADWERIAVKVRDGKIDRVLFYQHGGAYTRLPGRFQVIDERHPLVYVGKNSHGSYHDDGGSGTCLYFEDYRNPGSIDLRLETKHNLVRLERSGNAPEWMRYTGSEYWDGIAAPLSRGDDLCALSGCRGKDTKIGSALCLGQCGCSKSDIDEQPF